MIVLTKEQQQQHARLFLVLWSNMAAMRGGYRSNITKNVCWINGNFVANYVFKCEHYFG